MVKVQLQELLEIVLELYTLVEAVEVVIIEELLTVALVELEELVVEELEQMLLTHQVYNLELLEVLTLEAEAEDLVDILDQTDNLAELVALELF